MFIAFVLVSASLLSAGTSDWIVIVKPKSATPTNAPAANTSKPDPKQAERLALIRKSGLFSKLGPVEDFPSVTVSDLFSQLTFDDKQTFLNVVWAYYKTERSTVQSITLKDRYTNKTIGEYGEIYGGLKMK